jgi:hypothetical protein
VQRVVIFSEQRGQRAMRGRRASNTCYNDTTYKRAVYQQLVVIVVVYDYRVGHVTVRILIYIDDIVVILSSNSTLLL